MQLGTEVQSQLVKWAVIAIIVLLILKFVKDRLDKNKNESVAQAQQDKKIVNQRVADQIKGINKRALSFPEQTYKSYGEAIYGAFGRWWPPKTQNNDVLERIFNSMKNIDDIKMLIYSYGLREGKSLPMAVAEDMNSTMFFSRSKLNDMMVKKGIKFIW